MHGQSAEASQASRFVDDLVGTLFRDVPSSSGGEQAIAPLDLIVLGVEEDGRNQNILDEDNPFGRSLSQHADAFFAHRLKLHSHSLAHP